MSLPEKRDPWLSNPAFTSSLQIISSKQIARPPRKLHCACARFNELRFKHRRMVDSVFELTISTEAGTNVPLQPLKGMRSQTNGTFDTINGEPIRWHDNGVMHAVEGAEGETGATQMWPKCGLSDVARDSALIGFYVVTCPVCIAMGRRVPMV